MREVLLAVKINVMMYSVAQSETSLTPAVTRVIFSFSDRYWNQYWLYPFFCILILIFAKQKELILIFRTPILIWLKINIDIAILICRFLSVVYRSTDLHFSPSQRTYLVAWAPAGFHFWTWFWNFDLDLTLTPARERMRWKEKWLAERGGLIIIFRSNTN